MLFTALFPPTHVVESLHAELAGLQAEFPEPRWSEPDLWHITLGFYGSDDDAEARVDWLKPRLTGLSGPDVRLEGAGTFSRVLYLGVYSEGLPELARAAGAGQERPYLPHLTLARTVEDVPAELPRRLAGYTSQEWTATEAVLMRSERTGEGTRYSVLERFPLSEQAR